MDSKLNKFVKAIIDISFFTGIVLEVLVPFGLKIAVHLVMKLLGDTTEYSKILDHYPYAVVSIMLVGGAAILILYELRKMMKTVLADDCFVEQNVKSLYRMGTYAFFITGLKLIR